VGNENFLKVETRIAEMSSLAAPQQIKAKSIWQWINVRPLAPGRYEFFDDFHQQTRGVLVVQ